MGDIARRGVSMVQLHTELLCSHLNSLLGSRHKAIVGNISAKSDFMHIHAGWHAQSEAM